MTLQDLLSGRHAWTGEDTIYVAQPWTCSAPALLVGDAPETTEPVVRSGVRYEYFLEGFIAREFLEDLGVSVEKVSTEVCERLIRYAIDDA